MQTPEVVDEGVTKYIGRSIRDSLNSSQDERRVRRPVTEGHSRPKTQQRSVNGSRYVPLTGQKSQAPLMQNRMHKVATVSRARHLDKRRPSKIDPYREQLSDLKEQIKARRPFW